LKKSERKRVLKKAEAERLFEKADDFWKILLTFALNTGLRLSNVCGLKWDYVDLDDKMFTIPPTDMKNDDWLNIPMSPIVHAMLERLCASNGTHEYVFMRKANVSGEVPIKPRWVQREFRKLLENAEIESFHFHDLRHTCGQTMYDNGADLLTIKNCLGHRSIQSTMCYVHGNRSESRKHLTRSTRSVGTHMRLIKYIRGVEMWRKIFMPTEVVSTAKRKVINLATFYSMFLQPGQNRELFVIFEKRNIKVWRIRLHQ